MATDKKGFKWDGKTRVSNDTYRKNFNKIFKVKDLPKLKQDIVKSVTQTSLNKKYGDLVENIIERKLTEQQDHGASADDDFDLGK
jgi:hypothetical protein